MEESNFDLEQVAAVMQGTLTGSNLPFTQLSFDTRTLIPGSMGAIFIALKGASFDGHDFIPEAIEKGVSAVIAEKSKMVGIDLKIPVISVDDTTKALGKFAHIWRSQFNLPVIGITGSCGKTTVKAMLGSILSLVGNTLVPESSFNNQFGLPFSLLKLTRDYQYAVMEIGTNGFGEIETLTKILSPTHAIITNVQPAHLAGLKSVEHIAKEKSDIYKYLRSNGTAFINADQPYAESWRTALTSQKVVTFGLQHGDVTAIDIDLAFDSTRFTLKTMNEQIPVTLLVPGLHNVMNALAAASIAIQLQIELKYIVEGLRTFTGVKGRLKRFKTTQGSCVIDDSYNANPASFKAAIDVLSKADGNKIIVMGDMGELGAESHQYHAEIGRYAKTQGINRLFTVGGLSQQAASQFGHGAIVFENKKALIEALTPALDASTTVLVKGSRSARMEEILTAIGVLV